MFKNSLFENKDCKWSVNFLREGVNIYKNVGLLWIVFDDDIFLGLVYCI